MLEVLRVLSKLNYSLKKNVVFLFNGAEEDGVAVNVYDFTSYLFTEVISYENSDVFRVHTDSLRNTNGLRKSLRLLI